MKITRKDRIQIMHTAWKIFRTRKYSWGESMRLAWKKYALAKQLHAGIAYFQFVKSDATVRDAIGTLHTDNFKYVKKTSRTNQNPDVLPYWDIEKRQFRSVRIDRLISINS